jgi:hypothetical protein
MELIKHGKNVHQLKVGGKNFKLAILSDLHWDNPKCDWDLLKKHMDYCLKNSIPIMLNGDTFCCMQGRGDRRSSKDDIRPEHNNARYLDSIVETAVEWFSPYAHLITVIGYGNHECYREDTEVLTFKGWKNIKEIDLTDSVAVFDQNEIYYEYPNALVWKKVDKLVHIEGSFTKQIVSGKHAVVLQDMTKINAEDIDTISDKDLPHGRKLANPFAGINPFVEILTAIVMDATLVDHAKYNENHTKKRIQFKLSKPEKIEYIKSILDKNQIKYTFKEATKGGVNVLQPYYIRIYGDYARDLFAMLDGAKQLPKYFGKLTGYNFQNLINTIEQTDGHQSNENTITWNTTSKNDVDVVQEACVLNGYHFNYKIRENASGFANGKTQYRCTISKDIIKDRKVKIKHENFDGTVYCLNMPSGCFITRIDGKVAYSGNTAIIKWQETDILRRFVDLLNYTNNTSVQVGGYGGWLIINLDDKGRSGGGASCKIKYFHGSGGGGVVTKGAINLTRALEMCEDFDVFTMGHIHENAARNDVRESIRHIGVKGYEVIQKQLHLMITGTYKEEYGVGAGGWHIERGAPPKPLGGRILTFSVRREQKDGVSKFYKFIDSHKFNL